MKLWGFIRNSIFTFDGKQNSLGKKPVFGTRKFPNPHENWEKPREKRDREEEKKQDGKLVSTLER